MLTVERVTVLGSTPYTTDPTVTEPKTDHLIESYQIVSNAAAVDSETASVTNRLSQALPRTVNEAKTTAEMATFMGIPERSVRYGLTTLGSHVGQRGAGTRWDPRKFYMAATPNLTELSGTEPKQ